MDERDIRITNKVYDKDTNSYIIEANMPSFIKDEIDITSSDNFLIISANHNDEKYMSQTPISHKLNTNSFNFTYDNKVLKLVAMYE